MGVKDYSLNADDNTQINGINIAEGCPPSGINNAIRQLMADVKEDSDAQSEALKKFSETPASAENLGPVKVGDGLTMGEDGTLSLDLVDGVDSTSTTQAATANAVNMAYNKAVLPVGTLIPSLATSMTGYLLCNGAAVSRATYADLFALLDTSFGTGNGSTTFNLPDFRDRTFWGANGNLMSILAAGLPDIEGFFSGLAGMSGLSGGAISRLVMANSADLSIAASNIYQRYRLNFLASNSNAIYGNSTTVQPPAIAVNIFIKY